MSTTLSVPYKNSVQSALALIIASTNILEYKIFPNMYQNISSSYIKITAANLFNWVSYRLH